MSDEKQPELTPAEQQKQDQAMVRIQLGQTDISRAVRESLGGLIPGGGGSSGRTSFEGHQINSMIDLIENSRPEQLEEAGQALWKARDAIKEAAGELRDFIKGVDWEGESGTAFRDWGEGLAAHADKLGDFADVAGTQITVAGTGLASVRNSLPPRDTRQVRKSPDEIELPKRTEGNAEYAAAVKVEKDRQEAINQASRLASYYAVSEERLAAQEPPRFEKKLDVAMPRPQAYDAPSGTEGASEGSGAAGRGGSGNVAGPAVAASQEHVAKSRDDETPAAVAAVPERGTSTEINSVAAPPSPVTAPNTPSPAPTTAPAPSGGPTAPPMATGFVNPVKSSSRGPQPAAGASKTVGQPGNSGARTGSGPVANGRAGSPVGRPAPMGGGSTPGNAARPGGGPQSPTAGRAGITGGRPMASGPAGTSGTTGPRAGRANGIVGGTPQRPVPGAGTSAGARGVPRGPVIGAGGAARTSGPAGTVGQRGVVGSGGTAGASRPGGRGTPSTKGVVGTPRGAVGSGAGAKGFTAGGAGLVRGPAGRKDSRDEDQDDGTPRPDYLTEDRETWEAGRREAAPPVIE
ncbi:hypothetical protein [Streptomyces sp. HB132]|uniref:hypothetical protein n=1 Tax=Streptomyces sp. HB132 TaxID=767388 RepID=UPI00195F4D55|nr:hypothetical protein [Streptomyces sp. HB132]MBM7441742.1 hypothetical protein [Streptomyces sp. HB132]